MKTFPLGLRYMLESAFYFSIMSLLVKFAGKTLPLSYIIFARALIAVALSWLLIRRAKLDPWGNNRKLLVVRAMFGLGGLTCFYYAVTALPLADVTLIQYTNPVFVALFAPFILSEKSGKGPWIAAVVCLIGIAIISRPSFLFGTTSVLDPMDVGIAFAGALFSAGAYLTVRKLGKTDEPLVVVFWFPLIATPILFPFILMESYVPSWQEFLLLVAIGCITQIAQIRMTQGLKLESAARATAMTYVQIVFAFVWGMLLFDEIPTLTTVLGAVMIVATITFLSRRNGAATKGKASTS